MKKYFAVLMIMMFAMLIAGAAMPVDQNTSQQQDKLYDKQFNVKPGGKVTLDLNTGASIEITGWDKELLTVEVEGDTDEAEFRFNQSGNDVEITSDFNDSHDNHNSRIKVYLKVPSKYDVDFSTTGGGVTITGVGGVLEGTTMGGKLNLSNLKGKLNMKTMGGSITLKDSEVDGKVETMGGEVLVENVRGDVNAKSMGGKVRYSNVKGNAINVGKEVNITTMGGDLEIDEAPNGAKLKTMGGDISINSANIFVEAETMGGDIDIAKVDGWVKAKTMGGDVTVNLTGKPDADNKDVSLTSMGGDITLYVPDNFSMDVDIQITLTKDHRKRNPEIVSDFGVKEERTKEWEDSHGSSKKYIYGKGSFNGGKNTVKIRTINSNVYLKKAK